ncbi:hybrid sensor histidine kinase/response regulator [Chitinophaga sp.]|uniref:hybrid sensor histidine kinase/response regulator n=1 Tax=Chitinophaga sp. TaxID=1869181 RepID=UPI0026086F49|nr:hybrid sensor histidine kinase/response regulator [uncultured Chitinophaga sp.]
MPYPAKTSLQLFNWINPVIQAGTKGLAEERARKIRTINSICLITAILAVSVGTIFYLYSGQIGIMYPAIAEGALFMGIIGLNNLRKYEAANIGMLVLHCLCALYFATILGPTINISLIVVFMFGISFLIYRKRWQRFTGFASATLTLIAIEAIYYNHLVSPLELTEQFQYLLRWVALPCFMMFDLLVLAHYVKENKELLQQVSMLVFKTSHEMRNHLASNTILIDLLNTEVKGHPEYEKLRPYMDQLNAINHGMSNIVSNVLSMGELENGVRTELNPEPVALLPFLRNIVKIQEINAESRGLQIQLQVCKSLPNAIQCDSRQLGMAITNLITNAIKYSYENTTIFVKLTTSATHPAQMCIAVTNSCQDIPADKMKSLFNKFVTAKSDNKVQGSGLGLYIIRSIVEQMEGRFFAQSENGQTTFTILIPLVPATIVKAKPENHALLQFPGKKIFFAEDDIMQNKLLFTLLTSFGCEVFSNLNGNQLLEKIEGTIPLPECIMLDDNMPGLNGLETLHYLQSNDQYRDIPVIIVTGKNDPNDLWLSKGAADVLKKPYERQDLLAALGRHLQMQVPA